MIWVGTNDSSDEDCFDNDRLNDESDNEEPLWNPGTFDSLDVCLPWFLTYQEMFYINLYYYVKLISLASGPICTFYSLAHLVWK